MWTSSAGGGSTSHWARALGDSGALPDTGLRQIDGGWKDGGNPLGFWYLFGGSYVRFASLRLVGILESFLDSCKVVSDDDCIMDRSHGWL